MAGTKEIKRRIKSVKNTKKITKAMELVAASKMKRAVSKTLASRLYANYSWDLLTSLSGRLEEITHPFFVEPAEGKTLIVLITSNRGLCGAYNSQVIKKTLASIRTLGSDIELVTVGKKGDTAMRRVGQEIALSFTEMPDIVTLRDVVPLSQFVTNEYKSGKYRNIYVAYTDFVSALTQKPHVKKLLPISKEELKDTIESIGEDRESASAESSGVTREISYVFEGDTNVLIESLAEKLVRMQIYQMILESAASEQSSRMIAMKNASDAAGEMIDDLTLAFNKARQASITQEISEISAGMASIS